MTVPPSDTASAARVVSRVGEDDQVLGEQRLGNLADHVVGVSGVVGVVLGGSRARGEHTRDSDVDLGLYYRQPLDVDALSALARQLAGPGAQVTEPGAWGPWVDGGAWLRIDGTAVDWIYRDVDRVRSCWAAAQRGEFTFHAQVGHPLGVPDFAYAGELALAQVLADPTGELVALQQQMATYPDPLGRALVARLWEAGFTLDSARKAVSRADTAYVAGCVFRVVLLCAHALHGRAGRWLVNEKGAIASAGRLPAAPPDFTVRAHGVLAHLGDRPDQLQAAVTAAQALIDDVRTICEPPH
ncbi:nucleotidyltransferase domain-containing protein [Geodermatophilus sp. DSM 44513]|uniref:nucleotidyltransferase domain-containing protein n=1 Tax=Geodermatophilus sp. DSM 44513 TaxID=1528104 RepID=UPI0028F7255F|nr:nucleotidyltransferase domain-containing protein [Geodermatophilus sp. DSM 44513]WNV74300.1 nucleotidyltransferase domain-containing protein [Geodermatophilus sp. DSM 44513]